MQAVGLVGQFDDSATAAVTEDQFAPVRISSRRALLVEGVASGTNIPVSQATAANLNATVRAQDGSGNALTSATRGSERALSVQVVDGSGTQVTTFGGTQYTEDAAAAANPTGPMMMAVRSDVPSAQVDANGDNIALRATNNGEMLVKQTDPVPITDNAGSLTVDAPVGTPVFVRLSDGSSAISTLPVTQAAATIPASTTMQNAAAATGNGSTLNVSGYAVAMLQVTGAFSATITFEASTDDSVWVSILAHQIASSSLSTTATSTGDYRISLAGYKSLRARISAYTSGNVTVKGWVSALSPGMTTVQASQAGTWSVTAANAAGDIAHDGVDSGNPVKVGGRATNAEPTAVASGDRAQFITDLVGKLITLPYANPENFVSGAITTAMTSTTSTSLVAAPGAGLRNYITTIIVSNAHATVGTDVVIQDGSGGTTLMTIPAAAVYGGAVINLPVPLRQPTTNTALFCANVTTGASTKVSAVGYKGA